MATSLTRLAGRCRRRSSASSARVCGTRPLKAYQISSRRGWMPLRSLPCSATQHGQSTSGRCLARSSRASSFATFDHRLAKWAKALALTPPVALLA
jgi:hypothetical protein